MGNLNVSTYILLGDQAVGSGASSLMIMGLFFLAFWFLLIAPQKKKQKEQEKMISNLKAGDNVVTTSGIIGTIMQIKGECLIIKSVDSKIELHRSFIQSKWTSEKSKS
ncbi:MAG: preprotein translocase subunit YajC [Puniceicoccales bacterium]|jgi:preprotein translocase subunit YajC|nr:preprotein translocase subunit YajC [Puniceicoccales bacterium]